MDATETLYMLATAAAPGATVRATVELHGGGNVPRTKLCKVVLTGPDFAGEVRSQAETPEAATKGLQKRWKKARRTHDVGTLLSECRRLAGGLSAAQVELWEDWLSYDASPVYSEYLRRAASCRCAAVEMGKKARQPA